MKRLSLRILQIFALSLFALYFIVWAASPLFSHSLLSKQLAPYHLTLDQDFYLRYNPFISRLHLQDLQVKKGEQTVLSIEELIIKVKLTELLFDRLYIDQFDVSGITADITVNEQSLVIAGIVLPQEKQAEDETEQIKSSPYKIVVPSIQLNQATITVALAQQVIPITINSLELTNVHLDTQEQQADVKIEVALLKSSMQTDAQIHLNKASGKVIATIEGKNEDLSVFSPWLKEPIHSLSGEVNFHTQAELALNGKETLLNLTNTHVSVNQLIVEENQVKVAIDEQQLKLEQLKVQQSHSSELSISSISDFQIRNIRVTDKDADHKHLATIGQVVLPQTLFTHDSKDSMLKVPELSIADVSISQDSTRDLPALAKFEQLNIQNIVWSPEQTKVENVQFYGVEVDAQLDENKQLLNLSALASIQKTSTKPQEATQSLNRDNQPADTYAIRLEQLSLADEAKIYFNDTSVNPAYQRNFTITEFTAGPLDTMDPQQQLELHLSGKSNEYAQISLDASAQPFLTEPQYTIKTSLKELSLPAISAYIKHSLQHEIKTGQLDVDLDAKVEGDTLSGNTTLMLRGLDFTAVDDSEVNSLKDQTAIPFSVALSLLKDGKGNVELEVPLSGSTNDPSFGASGFIALLIKQATMLAAKDYLLTTFVPYAKVVSIAMSAGEQLLKVRFNDLVYAPQQIELSPEQQEFLKQFAQLMKDKPDTQVTLCPIGTAEDIGLAKGTKIEDLKAIERLDELSQQRFHHFKQQAITLYQLESSRILICSPEIDTSADAKPRITFKT